MDSSWPLRRLQGGPAGALADVTVNTVRVSVVVFPGHILTAAAGWMSLPARNEAVKAAGDVSSVRCAWPLKHGCCVHLCHTEEVQDGLLCRQRGEGRAPSGSADPPGHSLPSPQLAPCQAPQIPGAQAVLRGGRR